MAVVNFKLSDAAAYGYSAVPFTDSFENEVDGLRAGPGVRDVPGLVRPRLGR